MPRIYTRHRRARNITDPNYGRRLRVLQFLPQTASHARKILPTSDNATRFSFATRRGPFLAATHVMTTPSPALPYQELTSRIIGCFYEVYGELGTGFSERVFRRALFIALQDCGLRVEEEVRLQVLFRGTIIGTF